jgi:glucose/arabinose dehydrogenase
LIQRKSIYLAVPLAGVFAAGFWLLVQNYPLESLKQLWKSDEPMTCHFFGNTSAETNRTDAVILVKNLVHPLSIAFAKGVEGPFAFGKTGELYHVSSEKPIFKISKLIAETGFDIGGMSVVFHPRFDENGLFYLYYHSTPPNVRITEWKMNPKTFAVDPESQRNVLVLDRSAQGHSGGQMLFGKDGYMYISTGDGSLSSDQDNNAQNLTKIEGKILRIDVDTKGPLGYGIPKDNPDFGEGTRREIYAYGFRNPWRFSIDSETNEIWVGDVGDRQIEEISIVKKGGNYGWRIFEGARCVYPALCKNPKLVPPVYWYTHSEGNSVIGGIRYRGEALPWLKDHYVYSDYGTRKLYALKLEGNEVKERIELLDLGEIIGGFAEGPDKEIYFAETNGHGAIRKLQALPKSKVAITKPTMLLSESKCFEDLKSLKPTARGAEYTVQSEPWINGGSQKRFVFVPNGQKIIAQDNLEWEIPDNTIFVKNIGYETKKGEAAEPVETQVLVKKGAQIINYQYRWNEQGNDAALVTNTEDRSMTFWEKDAQVKADHQFPTKDECSICHSKGIHLGILGFNAQQLRGGKDGKLMKELIDRDLMAVDKESRKKNGDFTPLVDYRDERETLGKRALSYLHANCAHCHNHETFTGENRLNLQVGRPLEKLGICNLKTFNPLFGEEMLLRPGEPAKSVIFKRISTEEAGYRMPLLGRTRNDLYGIDLVEKWISGLKDCSSDDFP